jgi:hypothetical protein
MAEARFSLAVAQRIPTCSHPRSQMWNVPASRQIVVLDRRHNVVNGSATAHDAFSPSGICWDASTALPGVPATLCAQGRCGYGPRLPVLAISPWAKDQIAGSFGEMLDFSGTSPKNADLTLLAGSSGQITTTPTPRTRSPPSAAPRLTGCPNCCK